MLVGTQWQTTTPNAWKPAFLAGTSGNHNLLTVVNNQIKITGIKLEASPVASFLSVPAFSADFEECQRYYWTGYSYQSLTSGVPIRLAAHQANAWVADFIFSRRMCKVPTVVPYGCVSNAAGQITNYSVSPVLDLPVATLAAMRKGVFDTQPVTALATTGTTNSTVNITAIPDTTKMRPGQPISGTGIPAGATIATIVSGTAITISAAVTASATGVALTIGLLNKGDTILSIITADARLT
jgi:hypothetical protein